MDVQPITIDRGKAHELYQDYQKHLHYSTPVDHEIMRAYYLLSKGRLIIKALDSVAKAGLGADGLPKLAICRADAPACHLTMRTEGSVTMADTPRWRRNNASPNRWFDWPVGAFAGAHARREATANLPHIPVKFRPKRGLANYHILWEAEWSKVIPKDPFLLRRIGKGDMWLVVAMWDLTEVERTALAARVA